MPSTTLRQRSNSVIERSRNEPVMLYNANFTNFVYSKISSMKFSQTLHKNYYQAGGIKELMQLALPMIISMALDGMMIFTDRLFLAKVDPLQMNATLGGGLAIQVLLFFFFGLTGYSNALVAQYYGANEKPYAPKAAFQAIIIAFIAWPLTILFRPVAVSFFGFMNTPESQIGFQTIYLNILAWASIFGLLRHVLANYFTGIGKTKIVMNSTIAALVVNIGLDYILIFGKLGFEPMGIKGAAIATVSGEAAAMLMLFFTYLGKTNRTEFSVMNSFHYNWEVMKKLLYYGSPAGLEMFLNFFAFYMMVALFHGQGEVIATASTIMFNWDMVSFIPLIGIEIGITSLVGRYMGAQKIQLAERSTFSAIKVGLIFSAFSMLVFMLIPELLVSVFQPEEADSIFQQAAPISVSMIRVASLYVLSEAVMISFVGALRGAGDTYFTMYASIGVHWLFVGILYLSLNVFNISVPMSWFFIAVFYLAFCGVLYWRFKGGKWKSLNIIDA